MKLAGFMSKKNSMKSNNEELTTTLVSKLQAEACEEGDLDCLVYEMADRIAAQVNNGGLEEQVRFLLKNGLREDDILEAVYREMLAH